MEWTPRFGKKFPPVDCDDWVTYPLPRACLLAYSVPCHGNINVQTKQHLRSRLPTHTFAIQSNRKTITFPCAPNAYIPPTSSLASVRSTKYICANVARKGIAKHTWSAVIVGNPNQPSYLFSTAGRNLQDSFPRGLPACDTHGIWVHGVYYMSIIAIMSGAIPGQVSDSRPS